MSVVITGGGGFLGSHLAEAYLNQGMKVVCIDNFATGLLSNKTYLENHKNHNNLLFLEEDVSKPWDKWSNQIKAASVVFHFASPASPPHYQRLGIETMWTNALGLSYAMSFADQHSARVVFASTSEIYGDPEVSPQSEDYWGHVNTQGPRSCYDEAKRFSEALMYTHNLKNNTKHGLVRIFNTYGPRMNPNDGRVIINFLVQAINNEDLTIYGDGLQTRSFCYVDDLIDGIIRYSKSEITEPVNIGNDHEFTILQAAETVRKIFPTKKIKIKHLPLPADDPKQRCPTLNRAKTLLNPWQPKVQLEEGLKKMLNWLESI